MKPARPSFFFGIQKLRKKSARSDCEAVRAKVFPSLFWFQDFSGYSGHAIWPSVEGSNDHSSADQPLGQKRYLAQNWDGAKALFQRSAQREIHQDANPSLVMIERCDDLQAEPPPADWDGAYVMKTK
ncbi:MAG: hypothetical protein Q8M07_25595 [Prosthecobacter sp.]|nr:hypothetical protein [Prosthecobacter sp.]